MDMEGRGAEGHLLPLPLGRDHAQVVVEGRDITSSQDVTITLVSHLALLPEKSHTTSAVC